MIPNFQRRPSAGDSHVRTNFSCGVGHLLQSINLPSIAYLQPKNPMATFMRWGVPWAADPANVVEMNKLAGRYRDRFATLDFPDDDPERIDWFDDVVRQTVPALLATKLAVCEVARAPSQGWGLTTLERIATWARAQAIDADGGDVGNSVEFSEAYKNNAGTLGRAMGSPFPFPFEHPQDVQTTLSIEWRLVFQQIPRMHNATPVLLTPTASTQVIPSAQTWMTWEDMRYSWSSDYTVGNQILFGGHGIIRLFAIVRVGNPDDDQTGWRVEVGGRLSGYTQRAGAKGRARHDATRRA